MYGVFEKRTNGETVLIATANEFEECLKVIQDLRSRWHREYVVRDSDGKDVDIRWWRMQGPSLKLRTLWSAICGAW
jgi:hypothetical protein